MAMLLNHQANKSDSNRGVFQSVRAAQQKGSSLTMILVVLMVVAFLGLFAFKVVPSHLEYLTVKSIGQGVADNKELMKQPKSKVMLALIQGFRANSLWELKAEDAFVVTKDAKRGGYSVRVNYERRSNLFSNIDVVSRFNHLYVDEEI